MSESFVAIQNCRVDRMFHSDGVDCPETGHKNGKYLDDTYKCTRTASLCGWQEPPRTQTTQHVCIRLDDYQDWNPYSRVVLRLNRVTLLLWIKSFVTFFYVQLRGPLIGLYWESSLYILRWKSTKQLYSTEYSSIDDMGLAWMNLKANKRNSKIKKLANHKKYAISVSKNQLVIGVSVDRSRAVK